MRLREGLWACVYKGEVKRVNGNAKNFLRVRERKILETLKKKSSFEALN